MHVFHGFGPWEISNLSAAMSVLRVAPSLLNVNHRQLWSYYNSIQLRPQWRANGPQPGLGVDEPTAGLREMPQWISGRFRIYWYQRRSLFLNCITIVSANMTLPIAMLFLMTLILWLGLQQAGPQSPFPTNVSHRESVDQIWNDILVRELPRWPSSIRDTHVTVKISRDYVC